jgi:hypothetical protein
MAKATFWKAKEVEEVAVNLIEKYHQHLLDFNVRIEYMFTDKTPKNNGKEVWGCCRKVSSLNAYLAKDNVDGDPFFVIVISKDIWDILPAEKREALIDHELCHALAEANQKEDEDDAEPVKLSIRPHDLEEFACIVRRHGTWKNDIEDFIKASREKIS